MVKFTFQLFTRYQSINELLKLRKPLSIAVKKDIEAYWKDAVSRPRVNVGMRDDRDNVYVLSMFPYPSGKLHMGHVRIYSSSDALARFYRLCGKNVIQPIGFDSFGLPAENAAIDNGIPPDKWTADNIQYMKKQLKSLGLSFNWELEISTCSKDYYKWTQYLFLRLYQNGLAYRKEALVNWDPVDKTVLANEQVNEAGCSWRSGAIVEKKKFKQWFVSTAKFSKDLLHGLDTPSFQNWDDVIRIQKNWIGNCNGYMFYFPLIHKNQVLPHELEIWNDKPYLLCGISYVVISPDHYLNKQKYYIDHESELCSEDVQLQLEAVHPITQKRIPVFVSHSHDINCVKATESYAGIPGETPDDIQFANKFNLPEIRILDDQQNIMNSGKFSGMDIKTGTNAIIDEAQKNKFGGFLASNKLKDWLVSRQRYWGTPIPVIFCDNCGEVPVPIKDLPVELPKFQNDHGGRGVSLASYEDWLRTKCPKCNKPAKRETDTLDTFFDSSWYYLRYLSPTNSKELVSKEATEKFMPVDIYIGGIEHATLHLYYARLMNHFCYNIGLVATKEPFQQLFVQNFVYGKTCQIKSTGKYISSADVDFVSQPTVKSTKEPVEVSYQKMSKSKLNGVDPQVAIDENSLDTVRLLMLGYNMKQDRTNWPASDSHVRAALELEHKLWTLVFNVLKYKSGAVMEKSMGDEKLSKYNNELFSIRNDHLGPINDFYSRTHGISSVVHQLTHMLTRLKKIPCNVSAISEKYERALGTFLVALAPIMPSFTSELWSQLATVCKSTSEFDWTKDVLMQKWPEVDMDYEMNLEVRLSSQKILSIKIKRSKLESLPSDEAIRLVLAHESVIRAIGTFEVVDTLYVLIKQCKGVVTIKVKKPAQNTKE